MSTTTKSGGIFTFDHGQKNLHKAIGIQESYLDDLDEQLVNTLRDFLFEDDKDIKNSMSPSGLVEICATEFSYSQLVIMSSFYLQDKIDGFSKSLENKVKNMKTSIKSISIDSKDVPPHIRKILESLSEDNPINEESLPSELKDFLKRLSDEQNDEDED